MPGCIFKAAKLEKDLKFFLSKEKAGRLIKEFTHP
jgi:hypothetical protein